MLGIKIKSAVRQRVEDIAWHSARAGEVSNSKFHGIRNQEVVRAALIDLGYRPDCAAKPSVWRLDLKRPALVYRVKSESEAVETKVTKKLAVRQTLTEKGSIYLTDVDVTETYLRKIVRHLRAEGMVIDQMLRDRNLIGYRLIEQA